MAKRWKGFNMESEYDRMYSWTKIACKGEWLMAFKRINAANVAASYNETDTRIYSFKHFKAVVNISWKAFNRAYYVLRWGNEYECVCVCVCVSVCVRTFLCNNEEALVGTLRVGNCKWKGFIRLEKAAMSID